METAVLSNEERLTMFRTAQAELAPQAFAQLVATAAALPIAEQVIAEGVVRKVFPVDRFDQGPALAYNLKKRQGTATVIPRFGATPTHIHRYERLLVEPYIISMRPEVSQIDVMDANFNVIMDVMEESAQSFVEYEDKELISLLEYAAPDPGGSYPSSTETITISDAPGGLGKKLSSNVFRVGSSATAPAGGITGDPALGDLIRAQSYLRMLNFEGTGWITSPWGLGKLLSQEAFNQYFKYGDSTVHQTGVLRSLLGHTIVWSSLMPQHSFFLVDPSKTGRWVERNALSIIPKSEFLIDSWYMWERACPVLLNANALMRVMFSTSN